jgi:GMP synthase (glutamine-hydrolysing)
VHRPVLIVTHAAHEGPGLIGVALGDAPRIDRMILDDPHPSLPEVAALGGVVVMGGPMDANDDARHPGLAAERRLLADAVAADVPVLAVCLGMQLLAMALGSPLHLRHGRELGFARVTLTEAGTADPVLAPFAASGDPTFLHWHTDAVDLPSGATLLASTATTPVQAFRIGSALATQFHPEVDAILLDAWLAEASASEELSRAEIDRLRRDGGEHVARLERAARVGFAAFVTEVRERRGA